MMTTLGGIGLFLLGMLLLTDGIKALAGGALREVLTRFVRGPVTAMCSGTALTAVLQSSSATMLTTIGFVSAGLITFPQAIGVIFGANLGTTSTGWIVSLLGFKFSIGSVALPLVFAGAIMRLLTHGRAASFGTALAGFGLLFFGIGLMQEGMAGLSERIDLGAISGEGVIGALLLVLVGVLMTVAMQSSSAAMAITLAALHTGAIDITQGAALVIGQNIGTTVTAALAAIGASNAAKRTALAHILFNLMTGTIAFVLLPAFAWCVHLWERHVAHDAGVGVLAGFHTAFNVVGVLLFLPLTTPFAALIERLLPDRTAGFVSHLDQSVADLGPIGLETARRTLTSVLVEYVDHLAAVAEGRARSRAENQGFNNARLALPRIASFVALVGTRSGPDADTDRQIGLIHAIDHLERLGEVIDRLDAHRRVLRRPEAEDILKAVIGMLASARPGLSDPAREEDLEGLATRSGDIARLRKTIRSGILEKTARGQMSPETSELITDTIRRLDAVGYHTSRAMHYLSKAVPADHPPALDSNSAHRE